MKKSKGNLGIIIVAIVLLFSIAITTVPGGLLDATDVKDYSDSAKFFAGEYSAKHRSAHSVVYGLLLSPYVKIAGSFSLLKLSSAFFLSLLILSVYYMSGKDKRTLLLFILSPMIWYTAPWIGPISLASLLFLWGYYFIKKFDMEGKNKYLIYSGLLVGLAAAFWDTALYLSVFFMIAFLYNKKFYSSWIFLFFLGIGLLPRLVVNQLLFSFPFYGMIKHASAVFAFTLFGGIYTGGEFRSMFLASLVIFVLFIPLYTYLFYNKDNRRKYLKDVIFVTLFLLFVISNPQPRFLLFISPIIVLLLGKILTKKQFRIQLAIFFVLSLLVLAPYVIQTKYDMSRNRFDEVVLNIGDLEFGERGDYLILDDLENIVKDSGGNKFIVGKKNDDYRKLAHLYWGDDIDEFVSLEDYNLYLSGKDDIASKRIVAGGDSDFRREIWLEIGLGKNSNDNTNYENIEYAIGIGGPVELDGFESVESYNILHLSKRS